MSETSNRCGVCGKGRMQRNLVSHSKRVSIRYAMPNLRRMRINADGRVKTILVCCKCLKRGKVAPALPRKFSRPQPAA